MGSNERMKAMTGIKLHSICRNLNTVLYIEPWALKLLVEKLGPGFSNII